ncbi:MAG: FxsA family protein [Gammaproteobacteria bacterium]|nr:FxsA family protein [Gammaproteobacteria bacterium]
MRLLLRFAVFLPLIEVVLIVLVWRAIGPWWTLAALAGGSLAGLALLRISPLQTVLGVRTHLLRGEGPEPALLGGLALGLAGLLLLVPGFFTDFLALLLLVGPARALLLRHLRKDADPIPPAGDKPPLEGTFHEDRD